jgi:hypothetical protein
MVLSIRKPRRLRCKLLTAVALIEFPQTEGMSPLTKGRNEQPVSKKGLTIAKRTVGIVFAVLLIATAWIAIFPPKTPRIFLNQRRAVESIHKLVSAEKEYAAQNPNNGFACNLSDLSGRRSESPSGVGLLDPVLASGTKSSYHFEIRCCHVEGQKATAYSITATPTEPGITGTYALCADQTGEIWYSDSGLVSNCLVTRKQIEPKYR